MKKLLSITCVMLLAAGIAVAQDTPPPGEQPPAPQEQTMPQSDQAAEQITVRGCLSGSDNNFTISDQSGQTYKLSGDFTTLSAHVGHEVELTGQLGEVSGAADQSAGDPSGAASDEKLFEFSNVTMIAENCSIGTGEEARPESDSAVTDPNAVAIEPNATATDPNAAVITTPDASAQTTPPATTVDPNVTAQQPEAPVETAQQPETPVVPEDQPATEQPVEGDTQDQADMDDQLPQTATPLPLLALLGFGALVTGLWSRRK